MPGNALNWFKSYISERQQFTCIHSVCSRTLYINYGVPQGSILGPLLFLIYSVSLKKGNRDSIQNLSKLKRKIMKLLSVDDSIFIFISYCTLVVHIGSAIIFVKHVKTVFVVKAPANAIMQRKQRQLGQKQF